MAGVPTAGTPFFFAHMNGFPSSTGGGESGVCWSFLTVFFSNFIVKSARVALIIRL